MKYFLIFLIVAFNNVCFSEEIHFEYDGISLKTERANIKVKYPKANISSSSISLGLGDPVTKKIPRCRFIFNKIYRKYGGPNIVQKYYEASQFTHRRVWVKDGNHMSLRCYERNGVRYAQRVSLYEYKKIPNKVKN